VETRDTCLRAVCFDMRHRVNSRRHAFGELKVDGREGGLIIFHGVMLKVELVNDERFHSNNGGAIA
jgi:hypothetical protein